MNVDLLLIYQPHNYNSKMTAYEQIITIPKETRTALIKAGLLSFLTERNLAIYAAHLELCANGIPRMDIRTIISLDFGISEESVGLIISKLK